MSFIQQQQPKVNYQDFVRDIYNSLKKLVQVTGELSQKLDTLDARLVKLETGHTHISNQIRELNEKQINTSRASDAELLSMVARLEIDPAPISPVYLLDASINTGSLLDSNLNSSPSWMSNMVPDLEPADPDLLESSSYDPLTPEISTTAGASSGFLILE
jgi:hypothetical protein